ncbi:MAG: HAD-IA family hydrolase [Pseudomonadales bacterium]|nr:HAD-IA family hydrolase [Pseudomonadales bacterium]
MASSLVPRGVIFDLDGTILESEKLARHCFLAACADVGFPDIDVQVYNRCVGTTSARTAEIMRAGFGSEFPFDKMSTRWSEIYGEEISNNPVPVKEGIRDLLARFSDLHVPMAVATSSRRPTVETKLAMSGLSHYFEFYVCGGEADEGKPHPAPYLKALKQLELMAVDCWALEDSDNGVRSAVSAGLLVYQIPDEIEPSDEVRNFGHEILLSAMDLVKRLQ